MSKLIIQRRRRTIQSLGVFWPVGQREEQEDDEDVSGYVENHAPGFVTVTNFSQRNQSYVGA